MTYTTTRLRDPKDVLPVSEPLEPKAVMVSSAALSLAGLRTRAWRIHDGDRDGAYVVTERWCPGRTVGYPLLLDEAAAPDVARVLERARARTAFGPLEWIDPIVPHLRRLHGAVMMRGRSFETRFPLDGFGLDPRSRLATTDDLAELVDIYSSFELNPIPTKPRLRYFLRRTLKRGIIVMEEDGRITAAIRADGRSRRYIYWSAQTVLPSYRGGHRGQLMGNLVIHASKDFGLGIVTTSAPTSHIRPMERAVTEEEFAPANLTINRWLSVAISSRRFVPLPFRPRVLLYAIEGRTHQRRASVRPEGSGDASETDGASE